MLLLPPMRIQLLQHRLKPSCLSDFIASPPGRERCNETLLVQHAITAIDAPVAVVAGLPRALFTSVRTASSGDDQQFAQENAPAYCDRRIDRRFDPPPAWDPFFAALLHVWIPAAREYYSRESRRSQGAPDPPAPTFSCERSRLGQGRTQLSAATSCCCITSAFSRMAPSSTRPAAARRAAPPCFWPPPVQSHWQSLCLMP